MCKKSGCKTNLEKLKTVIYCEKATEKHIFWFYRHGLTLAPVCSLKQGRFTFFPKKFPRNQRSFKLSTTYLLDAVIVSFILDGSSRGQVENPPESVSDSVGDCLVTRCSVPDAQDVLLKPDGHNGTTYLLPHHELLPQHGQDQVLPAAR